MLLYRISSPQYAGDLSGNGAKLYGGRWNDKGVAMVYLASTRALAMMELLVHLRPDDLEWNYVISVFEVPDDKVCEVDKDLLPAEWKAEESKYLLAKLGRKFIEEGKFL